EAFLLKGAFKNQRKRLFPCFFSCHSFSSEKKIPPRFYQGGESCPNFQNAPARGFLPQPSFFCKIIIS
ncbi:MAG TPA: hypothetical protein P5185_08400, partial [Oscillospiraceae bacterium]|nr:hypothetical protein [Oscillospiraceae bacterium]